jgi:hypothetical protein
MLETFATKAHSTIWLEWDCHTCFSEKQSHFSLLLFINYFLIFFHCQFFKKDSVYSPIKNIT